MWARDNSRDSRSSSFVKENPRLALRAKAWKCFLWKFVSPTGEVLEDPQTSSSFFLSLLPTCAQRKVFVRRPLSVGRRKKDKKEDLADAREQIPSVGKERENEKERERRSRRTQPTLTSSSFLFNVLLLSFPKGFVTRALARTLVGEAVLRLVATAWIRKRTNPLGRSHQPPTSSFLWSFRWALKERKQNEPNREKTRGKTRNNRRLIRD